MKEARESKEMLKMFMARWKTLRVCYDTTAEDVQSLRNDIEEFIKDKDDAPIEYHMLLNDIEEWLAEDIETIEEGDNAEDLTEEDIYIKIAISAYDKIKNEMRNSEWDEDDEEILLPEISNMLICINKGDSDHEVAYKILNDFLRMGFDIDFQELLEMVAIIRSICKQEQLAVHIAGMAFELGTTPEVALARVNEILSL